jgi:putative flippase GtrA
MSEENKEPKGFVWTEETVKDAMDLIKDLGNKYLTYKKDEADSRKKYFEAMAKHNKNMTLILVLFLSIIVAVMSYLTLSGHVSGDALLFLIGTITGYVLLFVQHLVFSNREESPTEEP